MKNPHSDAHPTHIFIGRSTAVIYGRREKARLKKNIYILEIRYMFKGLI